MLVDEGKNRFVWMRSEEEAEDIRIGMKVGSGEIKSNQSKSRWEVEGEEISENR